MKRNGTEASGAFSSAVAVSDAPSSAFLANLAEAEISGYMVEITPGLAEAWLRANTGNRPVRATHVDTLCEEMRSGRWRVTHQGIAFSRTGRLIDGQHRLAAIVKSGQPATLAVFVDLDDDMFGALDRGRRRTISDELRKDARIVDPCTWIARVLRSTDNRTPSPAEVADICNLYAKEAAAVLETAPGSRTGRSAAGLKAGLMVRLHDCIPSQYDYLLTQWRAFSRLETKVVDTTTETLLRRLESIGHAGQPTTERGVVAWIAFHPGDRQLKRITIRDMATELQEIRSTVRRHMRDRADTEARGMPS